MKAKKPKNLNSQLRSELDTKLYGNKIYKLNLKLDSQLFRKIDSTLDLQIYQHLYPKLLQIGEQLKRDLNDR